MKKIIPLIIGMLFLILDFRVLTGIAFPTFIPFPTSAPESAALIIDHLVGTHFRVDIFPDIIGYAILFYGCVKLFPYQLKFVRCTFWIILAVIAHLLNVLNPFIFNGYTRYSIAYIVLIVATLLKAAVMINVMITFLNFSECTENHAWNNVVAIFMLISIFAMAISKFAFLYMWDGVSNVYYGISLIATLGYSIMYYKRIDYFNLERYKQNQ